MASRVTTHPGKRKTRSPGVYVVYRGVPLANTKVSRAARTRKLYEAMKASQDEMGG